MLTQFLGNLGLSIPHDLLLISCLIFTDDVFVLLVLTHSRILLVYQRWQRDLRITDAVLLHTGWAAVIMELISFILEDFFLSFKESLICTSSCLLGLGIYWHQMP